MTWVDGSPVDYNNWPGKAPDSKLLTADACVTTRGVDGLWHLSRCTERLGFVCKTILSKLNRRLASGGLLHGAVQVIVPTNLINRMTTRAVCDWFACIDEPTDNCHQTLLFPSNSTELFSIFQLVVLVFQPTTLLFWFNFAKPTVQ